MANYKFKLTLRASLLCIAVTSVNIHAAGTIHYRWMDDRGNPVHSDRPPPKGIDYEVVTTGSGIKRVVPGEEGAVPPEVSPRAGNEFTPVDEQNAQHSKKNAERCQRAIANLEALTENAKIRFRDNRGEERFLTTEEVIVETEKAKAQVSVYCP
ncbi:MAG: DUF4124 domain-containing protein [Halioglobus sp.]|nr:DUF4124 domain-containing protein [Halioglobus sp.]MDG2327204.1 DUF4124 domain-containing protein [Halioglobus sp.]